MEVEVRDTWMAGACCNEGTGVRGVTATLQWKEGGVAELASAVWATSSSPTGVCVVRCDCSSAGAVGEEGQGQKGALLIGCQVRTLAGPV